jgi:hypothetical protein
VRPPASFFAPLATIINAPSGNRIVGTRVAAAGDRPTIAYVAGMIEIFSDPQNYPYQPFQEKCQ